MLAPKGRVGRLQRRALSHLCSHCSRPIALPSSSQEGTSFPLENLCISSS
jgi:hypothetical protein